MDNNEYTVRFAGLEDAALLAALGEQTFSATYNKDNTPENLDEYLRNHFSPEIQSAELMEPGSIFLILETQGTPIGFVRLQDGGTDSCLKGSTEWNSLHAMELSRIYLLPAWTGHRLGDVLMQACIDYARSRGVEVLWLGVWDHNPHAIAFYQRWGFMKIGSHIFQLGQDSQTDFVMARRI